MHGRQTSSPEPLFAREWAEHSRAASRIRVLLPAPVQTLRAWPLRLLSFSLGGYDGDYLQMPALGCRYLFSSSLRIASYSSIPALDIDASNYVVIVYTCAANPHGYLAIMAGAVMTVLSSYL